MRDEQQRVRHQVSEEDTGGEDARSPKAHAAERERGQHADYHGNRHHAHRHDDGILEKDQKVGLREQYPELIERDAVENEPRIGRQPRHLGVALERRHDHVIGRHQEEDREQDQKEIGREQRPAPATPQARSSRHRFAGRYGESGGAHPISLPRLRTPRRMKTAATARIGNMNSDVAAPSGRSPERIPSRKA